MSMGDDDYFLKRLASLKPKQEAPRAIDSKIEGQADLQKRLQALKQGSSARAVSGESKEAAENAIDTQAEDYLQWLADEPSDDLSELPLDPSAALLEALQTPQSLTNKPPKKPQPVQPSFDFQLPSMKPIDRSQNEEDDLIRRMTEELSVEDSLSSEKDSLEARLEALQSVKVYSSGATAQSSVPLGDAPVFDPYEYEVAASDEDILDSEDSDSESERRA